MASECCPRSCLNHRSGVQNGFQTTVESNVTLQHHKPKTSQEAEAPFAPAVLSELCDLWLWHLKNVLLVQYASLMCLLRESEICGAWLWDLCAACSICFSDAPIPYACRRDITRHRIGLLNALQTNGCGQWHVNKQMAVGNDMSTSQCGNRRSFNKCISLWKILPLFHSQTQVCSDDFIILWLEHRWFKGAAFIDQAVLDFASSYHAG